MVLTVDCRVMKYLSGKSHQLRTETVQARNYSLTWHVAE